ncbi:MAG: hypothetical protein ACRCZF_01705, partial [Gemmataceae bacterium]
SFVRRFRKLDLPTEVTLDYAGTKSRGNLSLTPEANGDFTGEIQGLKESSRFTVRGLDFRTRPRLITLVPPPQFQRLTHTEYQPAYLSLRPAVNDPWTSLKGLRQRMPEKDLSLSGDKSLHAIRAGTELILRGTSDKPLKRVQLLPKVGPLQATGDATAPVVLNTNNAERTTWSCEFRGANAPRATTEFEIELVDDDEVTARRGVVLQVLDDQAPFVELAVETLRKVGNAYMVTPAVQIPFLVDSKATDDVGLSQVEFVLKYSQIETQFFVGIQAQYIAASLAPAPLGTGFASPFAPAYNALAAQKLIRVDRGTTVRSPLARFADLLQSVGQDTAATLKSRLDQPLATEQMQVVREVKFQNPQLDRFDLRLAAPSLAGTDTAGVQPRYRGELLLVATDTNIETGPKTGQNLEPIRLLIVSEADLLMEISKDEEALISKVDETLRKLREAQVKLNQMADRLSGSNVPKDVLQAASVRSQDIAQDVGKGRDMTQSVTTEYRRLAREAEANRCNETLTRRYQQEIIAPLQLLLDGAFTEAEKSHTPVSTILAETKRPEDALIAADRIALSDLIR